MHLRGYLLQPVAPTYKPVGCSSVAANDQDVVIVGAGPAGSSLAIELSKLGAKILLVDRESFPRDKPCGDYVSPKGIARLKELGVSEAINTIARIA